MKTWPFFAYHDQVLALNDEYLYESLRSLTKISLEVIDRSVLTVSPCVSNNV